MERCAWVGGRRGVWHVMMVHCARTYVVLIRVCVACACAYVEQVPPLIVSQRTLRIPEHKKPLLEAAGLVQTTTTKQSAAAEGSSRKFAPWVSSPTGNYACEGVGAGARPTQENV